MRDCRRFLRFIKVDLVKIVSVFGELSEGSCQLSDGVFKVTKDSNDLQSDN